MENKGKPPANFLMALPRKMILDQADHVCRVFRLPPNRRFLTLKLPSEFVISAGTNNPELKPRQLCIMEVWERGDESCFVEWIALPDLNDWEEVREPIERIMAHFIKIGVYEPGGKTPPASPVEEQAAKAQLSQNEGALTPREIEVAKLLAKGLSDQEIAEEMGIGRSTVKSYRENLKRKWGASNQSNKYLQEIARQKGY